MNHVLEVDGVQVQFNDRNILSGIYLKCETGTITGLLGRNGSGKSCLMNAICGTLHCEKSVRINRLSVPQAFKRPGLLAYLPQFPSHQNIFLFNAYLKIMDRIMMDSLPVSPDLQQAKPLQREVFQEESANCSNCTS